MPMIVVSYCLAKHMRCGTGVRGTGYVFVGGERGARRRLSPLICTERHDEQCRGSKVTERNKRCPSCDSNHIPSAIRADVLAS